MSQSQKNFWMYFIGSLVVAGIVLSVAVLPDTIRDWDKQYGNLPFAYDTKRAEEIMTNLLRAFAEQGDERSATGLLALEKALTPQYQKSRPLLFETTWSIHATTADTSSGKVRIVRYKMWSVTRPTTLGNLVNQVAEMGWGITDPGRVEKWVTESAIPGSIWPLEKRRTLAMSAGTALLHEKGRWRSIGVTPIQGDTDVLLFKIL